MQHDHVLKMLTFKVLTQPQGRWGGGGVLQAKYLLPCCCIRGSLKFDIQHDHFFEKVDFDLMTPRDGGWGFCGKNIC